MTNIFNSLMHSWKIRYQFDDEQTPSWGVNVNSQILEKINNLVLGTIGIGTSDGSYTYVLEESLCWLEHCLKYSYEGTLIAVKGVEQGALNTRDHDKRLYIHRSYYEMAKDLGTVIGLMGGNLDVESVCELAMLNMIAIIQGSYSPQEANIYTPDGWKIDAEWITNIGLDNLRMQVQPCFKRVKEHYRVLAKTR